MQEQRKQSLHPNVHNIHPKYYHILCGRSHFQYYLGQIWWIVCTLGRRESSYFSKGRPVSSWLRSKSSDMLLYKSSFCVKIRDQRFVLFSLRTRYQSHNTDVLRHPPGLLPLMTVRWSERDVFITFEIWIFILQKCMDSRQEAFIHPGAVWGMFYYGCTHFISRLLNGWQKHPLTPIERLGGVKTTVYIILTGFVW